MQLVEKLWKKDMIDNITVLTVCNGLAFDDVDKASYVGPYVFNDKIMSQSNINVDT